VTAQSQDDSTFAAGTEEFAKRFSDGAVAPYWSGLPASEPIT